MGLLLALPQKYFQHKRDILLKERVHSYDPSFDSKKQNDRADSQNSASDQLKVFIVKLQWIEHLWDRVRDRSSSS